MPGPAGDRQAALWHARLEERGAGDQVKPSIARAPDGRFVVAWSGPGDPGDGTDIFARRYDAAGAPDGGELRVNADTPGDQTTPAVAMNDDGGFVVAWDSLAADGSSKVIARRFGAGGAPAPGGDVEVAAVGLEALSGVNVATSSAGGFVAVWGRRGSAEAIQGRRYAPNGTPRPEGQFPIVASATAALRAPRVSMGPDGRFVVAWQRAEQGGTPDVMARRYTGAGASTGDPFVVNATTGGAQAAPSVAVEADGDFAIAWSGNGASDDSGVFVQRCTANGGRLGGELMVNERNPDGQLGAAVALNATGNFVVAWTCDFGVGLLHAMQRRYGFNNPFVVGLVGGTLSYRENAGAVPVDAGATVVDVDSANFSGGSLATSLAASMPGDVLSIRNQGSGDRQIGTDGSNVTYSGQLVGTTGRPGGLAADDRGEASAAATKTITLVPVNDAPIAGGNVYRMTAGGTLTVAAPGILGNDADVDGPSLQASLVEHPSGGTLTLAPTGGFTYPPVDGFAGADRFTYRATDGTLNSGLATVTITADPAACASRPPVRVEARPASGALAVTITAQRNDHTQDNALATVTIGDARNATIDVPVQAGTPARSGTATFAITLAPNTTELRFTVRRRAAGRSRSR